MTTEEKTAYRRGRMDSLYRTAELCDALERNFPEAESNGTKMFRGGFIAASRKLGEHCRSEAIETPGT